MTTTTENLYVGDGSTVLYSFTFPYIDAADVKVSLNGLDTTNYSLSNATTVELVVAPNSGVSIRIYRSTPTDSIAAEFYPGSAIRAQDLNANFEQTLYVVQESQAIIDNSDAASVVVIANEALSTANQAKSTADSVSGTANSAVTTANAAETTANAASADASTAQSTALAAQATANAALNSGSVLSDLSDVSSTPATTDQVLGWSGSTWGPVDQTGDDDYRGASAWGTIAADGTVNGGLNVASVVNGGNGVFTVTFSTPMPSSNYAITATSGAAYGSIKWVNKTAAGFQINTYSNTNIGTNYAFDFTVHA